MLLKTLLSRWIYVCQKNNFTRNPDPDCRGISVSVHGIFLPYLFKPHIRRRKCRPIPAYFSGICSLHLIYIRRIRDRHFQNRSQKTIPPSTQGSLWDTLSRTFYFMPALCDHDDHPAKKRSRSLDCAARRSTLWRDPDSLILRFAAFFYSWLYHGVLLWFKTDTDTCRFTVDRADCQDLICFLPVPLRDTKRTSCGHFHRSCGNCIRRTVFYLLFCQRTSKEPIWYFPPGIFFLFYKTPLPGTCPLVPAAYCQPGTAWPAPGNWSCFDPRLSETL